MKKEFFLFSVIALTGLFADAQNQLGKTELQPLGIEKAECLGLFCQDAVIGGFLGWNCSREVYKSGSSDDAKYMPGIALGATYGFALCARWMLHCSFGLNQTGQKWVNEDQRWLNRSNHLQLGVVPTFMIGNNLLYTVGLGLYTSYWLCGSQRYINDMTNVDEKTKYEFENNDFYRSNRLQAGILGSLGIGKQLGPGQLFLGFNLMYALVANSATLNALSNEWERGSRNQTGNLQATYRVPIGNGDASMPRR